MRGEKVCLTLFSSPSSGQVNQLAVETGNTISNSSLGAHTHTHMHMHHACNSTAKSRHCSHLFHTTPPVLPVDPTGDHTKHFCHCKCAVWGWACARQHRRMRGLGISPLKRGTAPALQWRQKQPRHGPGGLTLMQQHLREARGHEQLFKVCCSTGTRIPCAARV